MEKPIFYYVYIVHSLKDTNRYYIGFPEDLKFRLTAFLRSEVLSIYLYSLNAKFSRHKPQGTSTFSPIIQEQDMNNEFN